MRDFGSISPVEAMQDLGCMRLGARIFELKQAGHAIRREMETGKNRYGETTAMRGTDWMIDKQQAPCMYDVFGNEIYEGGEYWVGDEGNMADLTDREDRDPNNQIIAVLVETLGTRHILEELGYEKRTFRR